jgi:hypothetical protein
MGRLLNGSSDKIDITGGLFQPDLVGPMTAWGWVRTTTIITQGTIIAADQTGARNWVFKRGGADLLWVSFTPFTEVFTESGVFTGLTDKWIFVAATKSAGGIGQIRLYFGPAGNLTESIKANSGGIDNFSSGIQIGYNGRVGEHWDGDLAWCGLNRTEALNLARLNELSRRGWHHSKPFFILPLYGEDDPEPDLSGNGNVGVITSGTAQGGGPPTGPPFGADEEVEPDAGEGFEFKNVTDDLDLELSVESASVLAEIPAEDDLTDEVLVGDFAEIGTVFPLQTIETPPDAIVVGDAPETTFQVGTFGTGRTLMIGEFKLAGGTLFRAAKGIRHPERFYRGTVTSFGTIIRSIPIPAGLPQISDAQVTFADTDGELRVLMSADPPQNREVVLKVGDEGASEEVFQTIYTGVITHVTFPPGLARVFLRDISFQFLNEQSPNLLTRDNFLPDPLWAKNLLGRTEGRFDETEIFSPIVFGVVNTENQDTKGAINAVRLDSTTFNLAQHPIPHGPVRLFRKDPQRNETEFVEVTSGFSIVEIAKTIDGTDFIFTQAVFGSARSTGYELRWDGEGMTDDGTQFGTVVRNPIQCLRLYLVRIARRLPFFDIDEIEFLKQTVITSEVTTGGTVAGLLCDGAIAQRMTHREAITRILTSFNIFLFSNKKGLLSPRYIGASDPNRPQVDDVQDIYLKTETHSLARPIINDINLQFFRTYSDQSWDSQLTVDDPSAITLLGRREKRDLKLFFVRDDFVADKVGRDFLQFSNPNSFRIVFDAPGHRRTQDIELGTLIGISSYSGPDPSGQGYDNLEFLIFKTEFNTDTKRVKVHAVSRVTPPSLGLTESTSFEFATIVAADGLFENGLWLELTGRPPVDAGFPNPAVLPFTPKWIVIEVAAGFGGFPGVPFPTLGILDFGIGITGQQEVVLEGIAIITDQTGVDGVHSRTYSFPWEEGFRQGERVWVRARDNQDGPAESAPPTHNWSTDITFWR